MSFSFLPNSFVDLGNMTIKDLKEIIADLPDDMDVLVPMNPMDGFDGSFFSPCIEETQVITFGLEDIDEDEEKEMKLLGKQIPEEESFVLVPCGFFEKEHDPTVELN